MARAIAQPLSASLGKPVLVENRPGAGGNLAADAVAKSAPDGYTLLVSFTSHTINATLYPKLPFDPVADFTPISMIATVPSLLVGNPKLPAQDLKELIALAKAKPDTLTIAIGGIGSSLHLAGDQFKMMAGVRILNVPYKGTAPALTDVLGGQVDMMFISLVTGTAQVRAGKLRAYGVTSAQRQPSFPDLPAIGEVVKGFESTAWFGVFGPAKLPADITDKLNAAIVAALNDPKMRAQLENEGATPAAEQRRRFRRLRARRRPALGADREAVGREARLTPLRLRPGSLHRPGPDNLAGRLGLKNSRLFFVKGLMPSRLWSRASMRRQTFAKPGTRNEPDFFSSLYPTVATSDHALDVSSDRPSCSAAIFSTASDLDIIVPPSSLVLHIGNRVRILYRPGRIAHLCLAKP